MRVLYSAFSCNPDRGSEAQCGWSWAEAMSDYHEVHILTREENREALEKYMSRKKVNLAVHYCDIPTWMNFYYKCGKGYHIYYCIWQLRAYYAAKELNNNYKFNVIHHVTLGDFRMIGCLWKLNTKFVFGPVGGGQITPCVLEPYVKEHRGEEKRRERVNYIFLHNPWYRCAINKAYRVYAANEETQLALQAVMRYPEKCELLTENGVSKTYIESSASRLKKDEETVVLLWAGRIVYRKGLEFLLDVIEKLDTDKKWILKIVGSGRDRDKLMEKRRDMENGSHIQFIDAVSYENMKEEYAQSDIFVFPSLRETTGSVIFEAMVNELPIIAFRQNGVALIVDDGCGILVDLDYSLDFIKDKFCYAMKKLIENKELRIQMGKNAKQRVLDNFLWSEKVKQIQY